VSPTPDEMSSPQVVQSDRQSQGLKCGSRKWMQAQRAIFAEEWKQAEGKAEMRRAFLNEGLFESGKHSMRPIDSCKNQLSKLQLVVTSRLTHTLQFRSELIDFCSQLLSHPIQDADSINKRAFLKERSLSSVKNLTAIEGRLSEK
jgi:hypothetical protein